MILSIMILALLVLMAALMGSVVCLGRRCRREGHSHMWHKRTAWMLLATTVVFVLLLEGVLYFFIEETVRGTFFSVHLSFAGAYLTTLLALVLYFTGVRIPRFHRPLAYICAGLYTGTFLTGVVLLLPLLTSLV